eukprot:2906702-Pyramimonas_sp.AAC.1
MRIRSHFGSRGLFSLTFQPRLRSEKVWPPPAVRASVLPLPLALGTRGLNWKGEWPWAPVGPPTE